MNGQGQKFGGPGAPLQAIEYTCAGTPLFSLSLCVFISLISTDTHPLIPRVLDQIVRRTMRSKLGNLFDAGSVDAESCTKRESSGVSQYLSLAYLESPAIADTIFELFLLYVVSVVCC